MTKMCRGAHDQPGRRNRRRKRIHKYTIPGYLDWESGESVSSELRLVGDDGEEVGKMGTRVWVNFTRVIAV
jgi:hypothetical protein